jgi:septum formation protein
VRLYLASTSPARLATLRAAGIEPIVVDPEVDEEAVVQGWVAEHGTIGAEAMVELLARAKAEAVASRDSAALDGFILGGDSAFELDGVIYGKPHLPAVARERWLLQRGRTGHLHSGHWLIDRRAEVLGAFPGDDTRGIGSVTTTGVTFASNISEQEIDAYIATGEPLKVAGAFTIDSLGAPFITSVDGDPHAVVGLSLAALRELFLSFDVSWPELWNR